ncbi:MAG: hypothetical protein BIFFINMI_02997 [Phycisphaerae bacterium]|nr:hypothetical protein [Phycisphaerae bacterium]
MILALWWTGIIYLLLILLVAALVIALIVGYELLRRDFKRMVATRQAEASGMEKTLLLQDQLDALRKEVKSASESSQKEMSKLWRKTDETIGERLDKANDVVRQVRQGLGAISDASRRITEIGTQLTGLGEALRMPPPGSAIGGELWLADLLGQIMPPQHYELNAVLDGGEPIDALVRMGKHLLAIDAGFGPDTGRRPDGRRDREAIQKYVDHVGEVGIRPQHGTVDFALLYLPTESLYYELIIRDSGVDSIHEYALSRRVIPVSPNTLYAYLYTIVLGLRGLQIEQNAQEILGRLGGLQERLTEFEESFRVIGVHLERATNKFDQAGRQLGRFREGLTEAMLPPSQETPALSADAAADDDAGSIFAALAAAPPGPVTPPADPPAPEPPPADHAEEAEEPDGDNDQPSLLETDADAEPPSDMTEARKKRRTRRRA